jgi:hypothetical protein
VNRVEINNNGVLMTNWMSLKLGEEETLFVNIDNIAKISVTASETVLYYVNGDRELLTNEQAAALIDVVGKRLVT